MWLRDEERDHRSRDEIPVGSERDRQDGLEKQIRAPALPLIEGDAGADPVVVLLKLDGPKLAHGVRELLVNLFEVAFFRSFLRRFDRSILGACNRAGRGNKQERE